MSPALIITYSQPYDPKLIIGVRVIYLAIDAGQPLCLVGDLRRSW